MLEKTLVFCAALLVAMAALSQEANVEFSRDPIGVKQHAAAPRLAERAGILPAITLAPAAEVAPDQIAELRRWNDEGRLPLKNGFTRTIADPISVRLDGAVAAKGGSISQTRGLVAASDRGTLIWSGSVKVESAYRIRLHLTNVKLPAGATLWVWGPGETPIAFGSELLYESSLYTPSVGGDVVHLEIEIPSPKGEMEAASFDIQDLVELVAPQGLRSFVPKADADDPSCLIDATCVTSGTFTNIAAARGAIAHMEFIKDSLGYVCSGGLLNDKDTSGFIPYFLSAHHCFDTQASASSLEAFWDYFTSTCGGTFPDINTLQRSNGATLLATSATSDFLFLQLNSVPGSRYFLGWTTATVTDGTVLHRVSHPFPDTFSQPASQAYSSTIMSSTFPVNCSSVPKTNFLYSAPDQGGTFGGSSGSPVIQDNGQVVGQLYGACGATQPKGCDGTSATVDGKFSVTYPSIQQYINATTPPPAGCTPSSSTICLNNNRFAVSVNWRTTSGSTGAGTGIKYTSDSGLFWFFGSSNIEMIIKVLNACTPSTGNRYWVFAAATTNVEYTLKVIDTQTSTTKTYMNPLGTISPAIVDTSAFATCP